ncbi:MAG TPA: DUF6049 family protein [Acidimicrobiales bacterium]
MTGHGATDPPRRAGLRRSSLRLGAAPALAIVILAGSRAGAAGAAAGQAAPTSAQGATTVELVDQPAWVRPGEPFTVRVQVSGAPAGTTIDMVVHERLESRDEFRTTLDGELGDPEYTVPRQPLPAGQPATVGVGFTPGGPGTGLSGGGVYPVEVRAVAPSGAAIAGVVTYLSYLSSDTPEFPPLSVAVLMDIGAEPALRTDGQYVLPPGTAERAGERLRVLRGTADLPLTVAPGPETIDALAQSGPEGAATVDQLRSLIAGRTVLARPFVDVDLASLQRAGLIAEANAQADGGANVVRRRLGVEPAAGVWLSGAAYGAESARIAVDLGIDRAVVPPSAVDDQRDDGEPADVPAAPVRLGESGPLTMVTDPDLAAHLTSDEGMVAAHRFIAELTITWLERPSIQRAVVVHLPPDRPIDPAVVTTALAALADGQAVRVVPVSRIFRDVPPLEDGPTTLTPAPAAGVDLRPIAPALLSARQRVAGVGGLLDDPDEGTSLEHSLLLSTGTDTPDGDRRAYVQRTDEALDSLSGAVTLPDEFRITLTSRSSSIPVTLTNLSDQDLTVRVELDADQLEFPEGDVYTRTLPPGTTRIEVRVRARTSGAFSLAVTVTSPDGSIVLDRSTFDVRSTAISGVGLVLSVGAGLFLAIWWAKHWRSARRSRYLMPTGTTRPDGSGPPTTAVPAGAGEGGYRPAHMARQRTRSG